MKIRVFRGGHGDCMMLSTDEGHILIDGGMPNAYEKHWAAYLGRLRKKDEELDLVCISHIDRDHIGGLKAMFNNEVDWRLHELRDGLPDEIKPKSKKKPPLARPPKVKAIWHNAFFETVRTGFLTSSTNALGTDMRDILFRTGHILAGGKDLLIDTGSEETPEQVPAKKIAAQVRFMGQSVEEAISISRRISPAQLNIPKNLQFGGDFVLRDDAGIVHHVAGMTIRVLGPTKDELRELLDDWNDYLEDKRAFLEREKAKHDRLDGHIAQTSLEGVLDKARQSAIELAGNQAVTAPNLASIIMHIEGGGRSILMTGDADDSSIIAGMEHAGLLAPGGQAFVDVFKVPHHGAHNSYSDELARAILARHYVFCSDGNHDNPEIDVLKGYIDVLLNGKDGEPPALPAGKKTKFWFNFSPDLAEKEDQEIEHWAKVDALMEQTKADHGSRFSYRFKKSGHTFLVR